MPYEVPLSVAEIIGQLDDATAKCLALEAELQSGQQRAPGPYAVFYHLSYLRGRLQDVQLILTRMGEARAEINDLQVKLDAIPGSQQYSDGAQVLHMGIQNLVAKMRLDAESLYIFGNMVLDQWSYSLAYTRGLNGPDEYKFQRLVMQLQSGSTPTGLQGIKTSYSQDAIWLAFHLRMYRNVFIEHVNRSLQTGVTWTHHGDDLNFFIPAAVGWVSKEELKTLTEQLPKYVPESVKQASADYATWSPGRLLEAIVRRIDELERQVDRDFIQKAWTIMGGLTVSYLVLARRLAQFLNTSIDTIRGEVAQDRKAINFGPPSHILAE